MATHDKKGGEAKAKTFQLQPGEKPSLKSISRLSGMAVPTVSRALRDAPDISADTKLKVREIADAIGYIPNRAGLRLRTGRTQVISLVLSTEHDMMNLTSRLISSIATGLRGTSYHLVVTPDFPDDDPLKPIRYIVETGSADAIIINRVQPRDTRIQYMMDKGFPFASHGRSVWAEQHAYYDYDNRILGQIAVARLAAKGRHNLLLFAPPQDQNYALEMIEGAQACAERMGIRLLIAEGVDSDSPRDAVQGYMMQMFQSEAGVDGLISASPNATMAAIAGLEKMGCRIGTDLDVFSKDPVPILTLFREAILCAQEDVDRAGNFLAKAAVHAAQKSDEPPMQYLEIPDLTLP